MKRLELVATDSHSYSLSTVVLLCVQLGTAAVWYSCTTALFCSAAVHLLDEDFLCARASLFLLVRVVGLSAQSWRGALDHRPQRDSLQATHVPCLVVAWHATVALFALTVKHGLNATNAVFPGCHVVGALWAFQPRQNRAFRIGKAGGEAGALHRLQADEALVAGERKPVECLPEHASLLRHDLRARQC